MDEKCSARMLTLLVESLCTTPWCRSGEMPELSLPVDLIIRDQLSTYLDSHFLNFRLSYHRLSVQIEEMWRKNTTLPHSSFNLECTTVSAVPSNGS